MSIQGKNGTSESRLIGKHNMVLQKKTYLFYIIYLKRYVLVLQNKNIYDKRPVKIIFIGNLKKIPRIIAARQPLLMLRAK